MTTAVANGDPTTTILHTHTLHPPADHAVGSAAARLTRLAPPDWLMPSYFVVRTLLWYRAPASLQPNDADKWMSASRMRAAFERVLASYPLLAGRFVARADGTVEIVQGDANTDLGVTFVEATSDLRLDDLPLSPEKYTSCSVVPPSLQLLRPFIASDALNQPPVMLQHTRFACGSVCLGVHMHHWLADGEAYFTVLRDWRNVYERMEEGGDDGARVALLEPPCLDRSSLHPRCSQSELLAEAAQF